MFSTGRLAATFSTVLGGDDVLRGDAGNDWIVAGSGDDRIDPGSGTDVVLTGSGDDTILFGRGSGTVIVLDDSGEDTIRFGPGITLDDVTVGGIEGELLVVLQPPGHEMAPADFNVRGDTRLIRTLGSGSAPVTPALSLHYQTRGPGGARVGRDADALIIKNVSLNNRRIEKLVFTGGGGVDFTAFGSFHEDGNSGSELIAPDDTSFWIAGRGGDDEIRGSTLADILLGGSGDDMVFGRDGDDVLSGGSGDDVIDGGAGNDRIFYYRGKGHDIVSDTGGLDTLVFGEGITREHIRLRRGTWRQASGPGRAGFTNGATGADLRIEVLDASGNGTVTGSVTVRDHRVAGTMIERFRFGDDTVLALSDLLGEPVGTGFDDVLSGTDGDDVIAGLGGADRISGLGGEDTLDGGAGNDTLNAGAGDDTLKGGAGADVLDGGEGADTAAYAGSASGVTVSLISGSGAGGDAEGDRLVSVENLRGSAHVDTLTGDHGVNELSGEGGDDVLRGRAGDDTLRGGDGHDDLQGNAGDDTLHGGAGDDTLHGGWGDDALDGGAGDDRFVYSAGHGRDTVETGTGNDTLDLTNIDHETVRFARDGSRLVVTHTGSASDRVTVTGDLDEIRAGDRVLRANQVQQLIEAMAISPGGGGVTDPARMQTPEQRQAALMIAINNAWQQVA